MKNALDECVAALHKSNEFCLDLETTGLDYKNHQIIGIGLAVVGREWYFSVNKSLTAESILRRLEPILRDHNKIMVGHNIKFDLKFIWSLGFCSDCKIADTMVLAWMLNENLAGTGCLALKGKIGLINSIFGVELPDWKDSFLGGNLFGKSEEEYGKDDVKWTLRLWKKLYVSLKKQGLEKCFWELEMPMVKILAEMEMVGIMVDVPYLLEMEKYEESKICDLEKRIQEKLPGVNINSPKQLSKALFSGDKPLLKPKPWMQPNKNGFSTDEETMSYFAADGVDLAQLLLDFRKHVKILNTYIKPLIAFATSNNESRVYTSFNQTGTVTGRLSSCNPNLQNIPRLIKGEMFPLRKCFIASPGKSLLVADYSQLELRIMAHQAKDENMMAAFLNNKDIHTQTQEMLNITDRVVAKGINFGLIYGMSAETFQKHLWLQNKIKKPLEECRQWCYMFFQSYPGVRLYHQKIQKQLEEKKYVVSLTGRRRRMSEEIKKNAGYALRSAVNYTIQGSASDIICIAMRNFRKEVERRRVKGEKGWNEVFMLLQIHDELVLEAPDDIVGEVKEVLVDCMKNSVKLRVPLDCEAGIGKNWADAKR